MKRFALNTGKKMMAIAIALLMTTAAQSQLNMNAVPQKKYLSYMECYLSNNTVVKKMRTISSYDYTLLTGNHCNEVLRLESGKFYVVQEKTVKYQRLIAPSGAPANLIICDDAELNAPITIDTGCSLNIFGQRNNTGHLAASAAENSWYAQPGIGSNNPEGMGRVTIHGSFVDAVGRNYAAGIGGGAYTSGKYTYFIDGGEVIIYGGKVTAYGSDYSAGIGGSGGIRISNQDGTGGRGGKLRIYGGYVYARGGDYGAGIGGGLNAGGGEVEIFGGEVEARGGAYAAGIGGGRVTDTSEHYYPFDGGRLTVHDGKIKAYGGKYGAGIGGGRQGSGGTVTINGGDVFADGGLDAAGIGSGEEGFCDPNINGGKLTVNGGHVFADGTGWGAGIGGGEDADGAEVIINGGVVEAYAGSDAGEKNGAAFGSENGDGSHGSLKIASHMTVFAGKKPEKIEREFPGGERVPACYWRPYARVQPKAGVNKTNEFNAGFEEVAEGTTGIESLASEPSPTGEGSAYYTLNGRKLEGKPTAPGIYVWHGKKIVVK